MAWGVIRLEGEATFPDRLLRIHRELSDLILLHRPTEAAVEKVFLAKNPASALKLGQARGAAIVTCGIHGVGVHEYSAKEIKAAATGHGGAPKEQVAGMVARLLGIRDPIPPDASDALAMAFCRAVTRDLDPSAHTTQATEGSSRRSVRKEKVPVRCRRFQGTYLV